MSLSLRRVAPVLFVACAALFAVGCSSNNKGKIEGKWKFVSGPGLKEDQLKMMEAFGVYVFMEFKADGTMLMGAAANDPKAQEKMKQEGESKTVTCKYKLLSGDVVEIYDMPKEMQEKNGGGLFGKKDRGKCRIKIEGDSMTISDDDTLKNNPMKLAKVK